MFRLVLPWGDTGAVFPACAGMFRVPKLSTVIQGRFPRVCGDVPPDKPKDLSEELFSPRVRGCSDIKGLTKPELIVFPACAGMFLSQSEMSEKKFRFPRVCGDVPMFSMVARLIGKFSPRVRGCSSSGHAAGTMGFVFPACAGMFRVGA